MILGRDFLGLCALGLALTPAALLAQGGYGSSVLAQPTSTSVIASSEQEEVLAPEGEVVV